MTDTDFLIWARIQSKFTRQSAICQVHPAILRCPATHVVILTLSEAKGKDLNVIYARAPLQFLTFTAKCAILFAEVIIMKPNTNISIHAIPIEQPMVLIPISEYKFLLEEAGFTKTPRLDKRIFKARARFRKGDLIPWKKLKNELR